MTKTKSLNCYSHHAPKMDWINQFFEYKDEFDQKHSLGSQMFNFFKRFLRDAELLDNNKFSSFAKQIEVLGLEDRRSWALILTNLAYTPQVRWLTTHISFDDKVSRDFVTMSLVDDGAKEQWVNDIWSSYGRLMELPFNKVGLGTMQKKRIGMCRSSVILGPILLLRWFYMRCIVSLRPVAISTALL